GAAVGGQGGLIRCELPCVRETCLGDVRRGTRGPPTKMGSCRAVHPGPLKQIPTSKYSRDENILAGNKLAAGARFSSRPGEVPVKGVDADPPSWIMERRQ